MTSETQQNDMSMEDILSSIKDILENDSQEDDSDNKTSPQPQTSVAVSAPQEKVTPVVEEEAEEDVFDLSKSMIVEESGTDETKIEEDVFDLSKSMIVEESGTDETKIEEDNIDSDFFISSTEEPLLSPADIEVSNLNDENKELNVSASSEKEAQLWNMESIENSISEKENENIISQEDDFDIEEILLSASDAIAEDKILEESASRDEFLKNEEQEEIILPDLSGLSDIEISSAPVSYEEAKPMQLVSDAENLENDVSEQPKEIEAKIMEAEISDKSETQPQEKIEETSTEDIAIETMPINAIPAAVDEDPQEISDVEFSEVEEILTPEPVKMEEPVKEIPSEEATSEEKEDAADVSADIINNFAKMFAEQAQEHPEATAEIQQEIPTTVSGMGNGNKTIEQVVEGVIQGIVASSVNAEMTKNVDIVAYAQKEIHAQTRAWLEANLPAIVEAAVQKEIERVMAKVGK